MKVVKLVVCLVVMLLPVTSMAGYMISDGMGGFTSDHGSYISDGMGGFTTPSGGSMISDGMGGYTY